MVGVNGVETAVLKRIGPHLVEKPDVAALLREIDENPAAGFGHQPKRPLKLLATVAFQAAENIAGDALRMQPHERFVGRVHLTHDDGEMLVPAKLGAEHDDFRLRRDAQRHPRARHDAQTACRGLHVAGDVAVVDDDQVVVIAQAALNRLIA